MQSRGRQELGWHDMAAETAAAISSFAAGEEVFALFAGAVLALHQDTLHAYAIDMSKADDAGQAAAIDAAQPTPLGGFDRRVGLAMDALRKIERANLGVLEQPAPEGLAPDAHRVHLTMARMRATAARLWLLTMEARAGDGGGAGLRLGVAGMWTRLQTVPREAVAERAGIFAGSFYADIRSAEIDVAVWPMSP
jgi:hypothetical protein